ncbi:MAG TPA: hypothetical protein VEI52_13150 [Terriglobales bacterium]|nr:hypothetical protein [Terriglobales bacterium]
MTQIRAVSYVALLILSISLDGLIQRQHHQALLLTPPPEQSKLVCEEPAPSIGGITQDDERLMVELSKNEIFLKMAPERQRRVLAVVADSKNLLKLTDNGTGRVLLCLRESTRTCPVNPDNPDNQPPPEKFY